LRFLASLNLTAVGSALVYQSQSQTVESVTALPAATPAAEIARHQSLQRALARHDAPLVAQLMRGEVASGLRPVPYGPGMDPRLDRKAILADDLILARVLELGRLPSPFLELDVYRQLPVLPGHRPQPSLGAGVSFSVPFRWPGDDSPQATASLSVNPREENPRIGSGMAVYAHLPGFLEEALAARIAQGLNQRECAGVFGPRFAGAWCMTIFGRSFSVAFVSFVPSAWFDGNAPGQMHDEMAQRLARVAESFSSAVS